MDSASDCGSDGCWFESNRGSTRTAPLLGGVGPFCMVGLRCRRRGPCDARVRTGRSRMPLPPPTRSQRRGSWRVQLADLMRAQRRDDVVVQQPAVEVHRPRAQRESHSTGREPLRVAGVAAHEPTANRQVARCRPGGQPRRPIRRARALLGARPASA